MLIDGLARSIGILDSVVQDPGCHDRFAVARVVQQRGNFEGVQDERRFIRFTPLPPVQFLGKREGSTRPGEIFHERWAERVGFQRADCRRLLVEVVTPM